MFTLKTINNIENLKFQGVLDCFVKYRKSKIPNCEVLSVTRAIYNKVLVKNKQTFIMPSDNNLCISSILTIILII